MDTNKTELVWDPVDTKFIDKTMLHITMPAIQSGLRGPSKVLRFEVSLNGGQDWHTNPPTNMPVYTFLEEPQIISLSHAWTVLPAGFNLTLNILNLNYRPSCPIPSLDCGVASDIAYCQFDDVEHESPLHMINETHA